MNHKKKKLLIINKSQFGYHIDTYYYCKYLKDEFDITYLCFDTNKEKILQDGIKVIYVSNKENFLRRGIKYIRKCRLEIRENNYDVIFINYFQASSLVQMGFDINKFIIDIRTGAIGKTQLKRNLYNMGMIYEVKQFKYKTIISKCLQKKLNILDSNTYILPLGADILSTKIKKLKELKLLYIGTLDSRNIEETVIGLAKFVSKNKNVTISYDIFGSGFKENEDRLNKAIADNGLNNIIQFHGRKEHNELQFYFDNCNIGVSYIPITDYFDCQPPTKTFEYINSGMICMATNTSENRKLITEQNGILFDDNYKSFSEALNYIYNEKHNFQSNIIRKSLNNHTWKNIVEDMFNPLLKFLILKQQ